MGDIVLTKEQWDNVRAVVRKLHWIKRSSTDECASVGITEDDADALFLVLDPIAVYAVTDGPHSKPLRMLKASNMENRDA